jgi:hypothetical protein
MLITRRASSGVLALVALACGPTAPETSRTDITSSGLEANSEELTSEKVTGAGQFVHPVFGTVTFGFTAKRHDDGRISGTFFQNQHDLGFVYAGKVTCFAIDPVNQRAWIGGVLTYSNDPDPVTEVGDDAWFRVLDTGKGSSEPDRSTFMGFEQPPPGIVTSEEYCQLKIWPAGNARTWPVVHGKIVIH